MASTLGACIPTTTYTHAIVVASRPPRFSSMSLLAGWKSLPGLIPANAFMPPPSNPASRTGATECVLGFCGCSSPPHLSPASQSLRTRPVGQRGRSWIPSLVWLPYLSLVGVVKAAGDTARVCGARVCCGRTSAVFDVICLEGQPWAPSAVMGRAIGLVPSIRGANCATGCILLLSCGRH